MRLGRRHLPLVVLAGLSAGLLPTVARSEAAPSTASFVAHDFDGEPNRRLASDGTQRVRIAAGGSVSFSYSGALTRQCSRWYGAPSY